MHLSLHRIWLEEAFERAGCPICTVRLEHERHWLEIFLYDHSGDPGITHMLSRSRGFCHRHAWTIARYEEPSGSLVLALTYERLVQRLLAAPRRASRWLGTHGAQANRQDLWATAPGRTCPACLAVARTDDMYAHVFARSLASDEFLALYGRSEGLCLAHLNQVLAAAAPPARARLLPAHIAKIEAASRTSTPGGQASSLPPHGLRLGLSLLVGAEPGPVNGNEQLPVVAARCCRVCTLEKESETQSVAAVCAPSVLPAGSWLCAKHAWQASRLVTANHSHSGFAVWLRRELEATLAKCVARTAAPTGANADHREGGTAIAADNLDPSSRGCVVCAQVELAVREQIAVTSDALPPGEVCLRHLALYPPASQAASERHGQAVAARLQELAVDLTEFIRKNSWQARHEPRGREQDSWCRAISLFVGDA